MRALNAMGLLEPSQYLTMGNTAATPGTESENASNPEQPSEETFGSPLRKGSKNLWYITLKVLFVALCVIAILLSIAMIAATVASAITTKTLTSDQHARVGALIILAISSAVILSGTIYAMIAILRKENHSVFIASLVVIVLALIQALVTGTMVRITEEDKIHVVRTLAESFQHARQESSRHVRNWASIQYAVKCCGFNDPEDYRQPHLPRYMAPDVPISCCQNYDPNRSELVQERERQSCRSSRGYHNRGCSKHVLHAATTTVHMVTTFATVLIILVIIEGLLGIFLSRIWIHFTTSKKLTEKPPPPEPPAPINTKTKA